jgi:F0F1-type ATP synthase membrane subunit b/b'
MQELLREVLHEIAAAPARFVAEVVQSVLLLGAIGWVGRRLVGKRLVERRTRIAAELAAAEAAERRWAGIGEEVRAVVAGAQQDAAAVMRAAREQAEGERTAATTQVEREAEQVIAQAREAVEREKNSIARDASDRLVGLTTETVRCYLDEMLTEGQRRDLLQKAILVSLEELGEGSPPKSSGASRRGPR